MKLRLRFLIIGLLMSASAAQAHNLRRSGKATGAASKAAGKAPARVEKIALSASLEGAGAVLHFPDAGAEAVEAQGFRVVEALGEAALMEAGDNVAFGQEEAAPLAGPAREVAALARLESLQPGAGFDQARLKPQRHALVAGESAQVHRSALVRAERTNLRDAAAGAVGGGALALSMGLAQQLIDASTYAQPPLHALPESLQAIFKLAVAALPWAGGLYLLLAAPLRRWRENRWDVVALALGTAAVLSYFFVFPSAAVGINPADAIVTAAGEELLGRALIFGGLAALFKKLKLGKGGTVLAVVLSAVADAAFHGLFWGFSAGTFGAHLVSALLLAVLYVLSGGLAAPIVAHVLSNLLWLGYYGSLPLAALALVAWAAFRWSRPAPAIAGPGRIS